MVEHGIPAARNQQGQISIFRKGTSGALPTHSHVILSTANMKVLHELLFVAEQLALASPARLANKIRSRLCTQWNIPQFQKSADNEHSLFSAADMMKASKNKKMRDDFSAVTSKKKYVPGHNSTKSKKTSLFQRPSPTSPSGGGQQQQKGGAARSKTRKKCGKCQKWHPIPGPCKK